MEYGTKIDGSICDENFIRYVGYTESNPCIQKLFSKATVDTISRKVTELTMGVNPQNRPIIVPDTTICNVLSQIQHAFRPPTGDIYGRYNVPSGISATSYVQDIIDQTIEVIVSDVTNSLEMEENNRKLTAWTTVLGDFNEHQLRSHPPIKIRNKRPDPMMFNMNY